MSRWLWFSLISPDPSLLCAIIRLGKASFVVAQFWAGKPCCGDDTSHLKSTTVLPPNRIRNYYKDTAYTQWWAALSRCVGERGSNIPTAKQMHTHHGFRPVQTHGPFSQVRCSLWPDLHGSRCQRQWFDQSCFYSTPDSMSRFCMAVELTMNSCRSFFLHHLHLCEAVYGSIQPLCCSLELKNKWRNCVFLVPVCLPFLHAEPKRPLLQSCSHCQMSCSFRL